jgi:hypothetical protein
MQAAHVPVRATDARRSLRAEAPLSAVPHVGRVVEDVHEAGRRRAHAEIRLLAVAHSETTRVEVPHPIEERPTHVETESDAGRQPRIARRRDAVDERREAVHVVTGGHRVLGEEARQRADGRVIGERRHGPHLGRRARGTRQLLEPAGGHLRVAVEQHDVALSRGFDTAIRRGCEAAPLGLAKNQRLAVVATCDCVERSLHRLFLGSVEDDHQAVTPERAVGEHARQTAREVRGRTVHRHHDVDPGHVGGSLAGVSVAQVGAMTP